MADQAVLITGATSGLGNWLSHRLAQAGLVVLVHGRDQRKVDQTVHAVRAAGGTAQGFVADLASLDACRRLADEVGARGDLTVLVNNAGVGFGPPGQGRELSADGYELHWAINYLAPVVITRELIPTLKANAPARIVNVGSLGQVSIDFTDLQAEREYDGTVAYRRSKLALAAWSFELAEELSGDRIAVNCIHPATFMDTQMVTEAGIAPTSTVDDGGAAVSHLVLDATGSGDFYDGTRVSQAHRDAYDPAVRAALRGATEAMLA